jgi:hypothetical protein
MLDRQIPDWAPAVPLVIVGLVILVAIIMGVPS